MAWVDLVILIALVEYFYFAVLVGQARQRYGIKAPAMSGNDIVERHIRVQQNTLELLIIYIPVLWIAARYWNPVWMAAIGAVFPIGRFIYLGAYVRDPGTRTLGFFTSFAPIVVLAVMALIGAVRSLL
jgi:glutathione S-transferase